MSDDVEQLVSRLVDAGPAGSRTIIPKAQAEALVHRDLLDHSRQETADALDISVYTVDDRLARARDNLEAVGAVAEVLLDVDLLDVDLVTPEEHRAAERRREAAQEPRREREPERPTHAAEEPVDGAPTAWGRLMALDAVTKVTRSEEGDSLSITVKNATDAELDAVRDVVDELGLVIFSGLDYGQSGVSTIHAREPEQETDESAQSAAQSEPSSEPDAEGIEEPDADESAESYVCDDCGKAFDTRGGLGGHRKYCPERSDDEQGPGERDVEALSDVGPTRGESLRQRGYETVADVAEATPSKLLDKGTIGDVTAARISQEAREMLEG